MTQTTKRKKKTPYNLFRSKNIWAQYDFSTTDETPRNFRVVINCNDREEMEAIQKFLVRLQ